MQVCKQPVLGRFSLFYFVYRNNNILQISKSHPQIFTPLYLSCRVPVLYTRHFLKCHGRTCTDTNKSIHFRHQTGQICHKSGLSGSKNRVALLQFKHPRCSTAVALFKCCTEHGMVLHALIKSSESHISTFVQLTYESIT